MYQLAEFFFFFATVSHRFEYLHLLSANIDPATAYIEPLSRVHQFEPISHSRAAGKSYCKIFMTSVTAPLPISNAQRTDCALSDW